MSRPSIPELAIRHSELEAERATCDRLHVGAVIFDDYGRIIATGRNGSPSGRPHCDDVGHLLVDGHCLRTIHAELNACLQAGPEANGQNMASRYRPCLGCSNVIIQVRIKRFFYREVYGNDRSDVINLTEYLADGGVRLIQIPEGDTQWKMKN